MAIRSDRSFLIGLFLKLILSVFLPLKHLIKQYVLTENITENSCWFFLKNFKLYSIFELKEISLNLVF